MAHPYRIREIAQQSGLSPATIDRVLNGRTGVRPSTVAEVQQAITELDRQATQLRIGGRTFLVDLVMQTPTRFSTAVRNALESELPHLRPAVFRARFHLQEESSPAEVVRTLDDIGRRGSQGVILKAPDDPEVTDAVERLHGRGIPVVTFVTDVPASRRIAYVGIDNRAAGATAAYLLSQWRGRGNVLVTLSSNSFLGEDERLRGFRDAMLHMAPERAIREVTGTDGLDESMLEAVGEALADDPAIESIYSIGGGNAATVAAFDRAGRTYGSFIAHDLDDDNSSLLRSRRISVVLHHDMRDDIRRVSRLIMQHHGAVPGPAHSVPSHIQIVTPLNEPSAFSPPR